MRLVLPFLLLALAPLPAQRSLPTRADLSAVEESLYGKLMRQNLERPMEVLGLPRGIYLEGYGAVFTAEVNLILTPGLSPFRPQLTKEEIAEIRALKLKSLPTIRQTMQQMLLDSAASLDRLPTEEQVVVGVVFFYNKWEDRTGLPLSITMKGRKQELLKIAMNPALKTSLGSSIQVREE